MNLITEKEYRDFIKFRDELNELILTKTTQLSLIIHDRPPIGTCYNYDFEEENGKLVVQFETPVCQDTPDCDIFYLPLKFLFDESYPEKYKLIWDEEKRKEREEKEKKKKEEEENKKKKCEIFEKKEYERLKLKFEKKD